LVSVIFAVVGLSAISREVASKTVAKAARIFMRTLYAAGRFVQAPAGAARKGPFKFARN